MTLSLVIAAGGTGGHMIPADALSAVLQQRGHRVTLLTDVRGLRIPGLFADAGKHVIPAATASGMNPIAWAKACWAVYQGRAAGRQIARDVSAHAVIGFGGYPALPGMLAGIALKLPVILHEQNAVLGRVNRYMAKKVSAIALTYADTLRVDGALERKVQVTGNPVRQAIIDARQTVFSAPAGTAPFRLLVTGGSQGARVLSTLVPAAIAALPAPHRSRLVVQQQCRPEDLSAVVAAYRAAGVEAECLAYMADLPERMAAAHLVVSRAGASTMAELMVMGRPAILIPFKAATDDHQTANAAGFVAAGAGVLLPEDTTSPATLSGHLSGFMGSPEALAGAAAAARQLGHPDAAEKLADLVEKEVRDRG